MLKIPMWRIVVVALATLWAVVFALPNAVPEPVRKNIPILKDLQAINLGLDLRGGSYLLLEVDSNALIHQQTENVVDQMAQSLRKAKPAILFTGRGVVDDVARLRVANPEDLSRAMKLLAREVNEPIAATGFGGAGQQLDITQTPDGVIEARISEQQRKALITRSVAQSIEVLRRRIDPNGTSEVSIAREGADRIVVQAPGEQDPDALKRRIGTTARMTFHLVNMNIPAEDAAQGRVPPGTELIASDNPVEPLVPVFSRVDLSGEDLARASVGFDQNTGHPIVSLQFNSAGAKAFGRITTLNVDKRFAIILDNKVLTAPTINEPIPSGRAQISGGFTPERAKELVDLLNAGALPVPLSIIEQRSVGPGLGQDAIDAGTKAGVLALVLVLGFMIVFYGLFGFFACVAMIINMIIIIAAMSTWGAALTLPGIAGLVLTGGIAVDANVLIYERMREEEAAGRGPAMAIEAGFARAFMTILDAHVTTVVSAAILFALGAGPVKGFAWTLVVGVGASLFTALLITQLFIAWWFRATRPKKLPI